MSAASGENYKRPSRVVFLVRFTGVFKRKQQPAFQAALDLIS
jgi:hypothetical protein